MFGEEVFRSGSLEMPTQPWEGLEQVSYWTDLPANRIVVLISVVLMVVNLMDYIQLMPALLFSADRSRGAEMLEHSLGLSRTRNLTALVYLLPLCITIDRYAAARPEFWNAIPPQWSLAATTGMTIAVLLLRRLCYAVFRPRELSGESFAAILNNPYTFLLLAAPVLFLTMGVIAVFNLSPMAGWHLILAELGLAWLFAIFRSGQILRKRCSGLSTILYLCGLEFLPAAIMVAVMIFF